MAPNANPGQYSATVGKHLSTNPDDREGGEEGNPKDDGKREAPPGEEEYPPPPPPPPTPVGVPGLPTVLLGEPP